jgi:hypothetical protein
MFNERSFYWMQNNKKYDKTKMALEKKGFCMVHTFWLTAEVEIVTMVEYHIIVSFLDVPSTYGNVGRESTNPNRRNIIEKLGIWEWIKDVT